MELMIQGSNPDGNDIASGKEKRKRVMEKEKRDQKERIRPSRQRLRMVKRMPCTPTAKLGQRTYSGTMGRSQLPR